MEMNHIFTSEQVFTCSYKYAIFSSYLFFDISISKFITLKKFLLNVKLKFYFPEYSVGELLT